MQIMRFTAVLLLSISLSAGVACCGGDAEPELHIEPSLPAGARVDVVVDKLERTCVYPEELGETPSAVFLEEGKEYAILYAFLDTVEGGRVRSLWADTELLIDTEDREYKVQKGSWTGIQLLVPEMFLDSPREVVEGAEGVMVFVIPEEAEIAVLRLTYSFSLDWEEPGYYLMELPLL